MRAVWSGRFLPRSIRGTLLLLLLIVLVPGLLYQVVHEYGSLQTRRARELQANLDLARSVAASLDAFVHDITSQELALGVALTSSPPLPAEQVNRLLGTAARDHSSIRHYSWISPQGRIVDSTETMIAGLDISDSQYFQEIIQGKELVVSDLFQHRFTGEAAFVIARGIRDERGLLQGVVAADIDPRLLGGILIFARPERGDIIIADSRGRLVYRYPEVDLAWEERGSNQIQPAIARALEGEEVATVVVSPVDGRRLMAAAIPTRSSGWVAGASRPEAEVLVPAIQTFFRDLGLLAVVAIGAFLVALAISRIITLPISRLREQAVRLGKGELGRRVDVRGPVELEELATNFNRMAEEIKIREEQSARLYAAEQSARTEAEELEKKFLLLLESTDEGIYGTDSQGHCTFANKSGARMVGYAPEDLIDKSIHYIIHHSRSDGSPYPLEECPLFRALRLGEGTRSDKEVFWRRDGSSFPVEYSSHPIVENGEVKGAVVTFVDITERKKAEQFREEYVSLVSHDLRAPLTIIQGQAQFLRQRLAGAGITGPELSSVNAIVTSARRINVMIQDLVDSARLEAGQLQLQQRPLDLRSFVYDLLERAKGVFDVSRVNVDIPSVLPPVNADPDRLERILLNLLSNALKYSPPDTPVSIRAERTEKEVTVSVADRGVGIAPEDLPHLFERFYRAKGTRKTEGLGLGLYITRMLVEAHRGGIWVESEPGKGSTFYFTLPLA